MTVGARMKSWIKSKPALYDRLNSLRPIRTPVECWLNSLPKTTALPITFIQIGANNGLRWDPFRRFIIRDRWRGVFVEPIPVAFSLLRKNYLSYVSQGLMFVNAAAGADDAEALEIYSPDSEFLNQHTLEDQMYLLRVASHDKAHVLSRVAELGGGEQDINKASVPLVSVERLVNDYLEGQPPVLLAVDAEGYDSKIIRSINLDKLRPRNILFESHNLGADRHPLYRYLEAHDYMLVELGGDSVAISCGNS